LMKSVSRRISDGRMLRLFKMWLESPVEETDAKGDRHRTTRNKDRGMGTPQGSPVSPLLSNLYMRRFVKGWRTGGHERRLDAHVVNYADDFVICCRGTADEAMTVMREMMSKLKLTVNEKKTRLCRLPEETFNFLGYTLGRNYDCRTGEPYLGPRPSRQKIARIGREIHELTTRRTTGLEVDELVRRINAKLRGWSNYFRIGTKSKAYRSIDTHVRQRVRQWLRVKFKVKGSAKQRYPDGYLYQELGLVQLQ
jgi:RNA-directed DNA polymerase